MWKAINQSKLGKSKRKSEISKKSICDIAHLLSCLFIECWVLRVAVAARAIRNPLLQILHLFLRKVRGPPGCKVHRVLVLIKVISLFRSSTIAAKKPLTICRLICCNYSALTFGRRSPSTWWKELTYQVLVVLFVSPGCLPAFAFWGKQVVQGSHDHRGSLVKFFILYFGMLLEHPLLTVFCDIFHQIYLLCWKCVISLLLFAQILFFNK